MSEQTMSDQTMSEQVTSHSTMSEQTISDRGGDPRFEDKSLTDLLRGLSEDSSKLLRQQSELFRSEMQQQVNRTKRQIVVLGAGGLLAYVGLLALTACVILGLSVALPAWAAALIVGSAYVVLGGVLLAAGRSRLARGELGPTQTIDSVKGDVRALREAFR